MNKEDLGAAEEHSVFITTTSYYSLATSRMTPTTKRVEHSANIAAHQLLFTGRDVGLHNAYMLFLSLLKLKRICWLAKIRKTTKANENLIQRKKDVTQSIHNHDPNL